MDIELVLDDGTEMGDAPAAAPLPAQTWCQSCAAHYPVSHIIDDPANPKHGEHF